MKLPAVSGQRLPIVKQPNQYLPCPFIYRGLFVYADAGFKCKVMLILILFAAPYTVKGGLTVERFLF